MFPCTYNGIHLYFLEIIRRKGHSAPKPPIYGSSKKKRSNWINFSYLQVFLFILYLFFLLFSINNRKKTKK
ncbi:Putative membrane protein [Zobellia galactanivorans]|uniref:Putative membrane protein n=1 Tax=Zobellia galactanivorans (strain DSM 12802 / CCUG 47099 / CIP 106680 / NCIMB 13871 / Dsij) TaxID=63186 RepID=G0L6X6_ZOBGA|nr:Putative membrane protein [Zobellia galactanivorans]